MEIKGTDNPWVFSIGRFSEGCRAPLPGQLVGPGDFDTRSAAEEAAKLYVDHHGWQ